ncbi:hypothetical protein CW731_11955 [Polaribacter sp. ALD11]|uniref:sensor histidine kinase n=1 Tax=Polaribacter sp. ALD11 TaxID=2058137 RepID=UPI000C30F57D|nr:sensor histidine kinase [Polaribacter sp. ALD11]AUC85961.1 hypothetical protein CW731_11955 [Polaribacter sp. ALD11]
MKLFLSLLFLLFSVFSFSQEGQLSIEKIKTKIEVAIVENKLDSISFYLKQLETDTDTEIYNKLIDRKKISYSEFSNFISRQGNRHSLNFSKVSNYINSYIKEPTDTKKINLSYVDIKWIQVTKLRDNVSLDEASLEQEKLERYINKFSDLDTDVLRSKVKINTHPIVMYLIQKDVKNGKILALKSLETARKLKDKKLEITFLYHLSDFLLLERNLDAYIAISEESLQIEKEFTKKSSYYHSTIEHLVDAYIFKGGKNERVLALINILSEDNDTNIYTYSLYLKLIVKLKKKSLVEKEILQKFEVKNISELITKFEILGKDLNSNDLYKFYRNSSNVLESYGFYKEALAYIEKAIVITRKTYSEDLSKSLASFKTEQAVKKKELEIEYEKQKTKLYSIIAVIAVFFFLISLFVIRKVKKQSKELSAKNKVIKETIKEKELLVKEVHHRVKNNFQIVSSLLELQSKGIEDEKALELANEGKNRVKSMALIHQKLYQNNSGLVDFDEYIQQLTKELSCLYNSKENVETFISSKNMLFDVDTAIPLGLIINEIITNSYKYAFKNDKENKLSISINKVMNEDYKLIIEDNGPGLPVGFDAKKATSLGLRLVNRLVKQLYGKLNQTNVNGARFEILFKDDNARKLVN